VKNIYLICIAFILIASCKKDALPVDLPTKVTTFRYHGLDVSWDQSGSNRIAYSAKETDGHYDIHLANHAVWAGLGSIASDGSRFIGGRQTSLVTKEGEIMMVEIIH
jgi:hypothetical protein